MPKKKVKGFVILNKDQGCLTDELYWFDHYRLEDAFVHPDWRAICQRALEDKWESIPHRFYEATYDSQSGAVEITGRPVVIQYGGFS